KVKFVKTTIEETLISRSSKNLFLSWLQQEYKIDLNKILYSIRKSESSIFCYKRRKHNYEIENLNPRKNLKKHIYFIKKRRTSIDNILVDYIRVLYFNGKFDNLENTVKSESKNQIDRKLVYQTIKKQLTLSNTSISNREEKEILRKLGLAEHTSIS